MLDLKKMHKKILLGFFILFAIVIWAAAYIACSNSDAYLKASEFVLSNNTISEVTGKILNSRMGFYSFNVSQGLKLGSAEFTIVVSGEKANAEVMLLLEKNASGWKVIKAALDTGQGQLVLLETPDASAKNINQKQALEIAENEFIKTYGTEVLNQKPFRANLWNGVWRVSGTLSCPKGTSCKGGVAEIELSETDGKVLKLTHGK